MRRDDQAVDVRKRCAERRGVDVDDLHVQVAANGGVGDVPTVLRFAPPAPNPLHRSTTFAFDLPHRGAVRQATLINVAK